MQQNPIKNTYRSIVLVISAMSDLLEWCSARNGFAHRCNLQSWPVSFKIDSRYLEHTLTRDQVLEDRHFHKA